MSWLAGLFGQAQRSKGYSLEQLKCEARHFSRDEATLR
jgi:hypothetical protein